MNASHAAIAAHVHRLCGSFASEAAALAGELAHAVECARETLRPAADGCAVAGLAFQILAAVPARAGGGSIASHVHRLCGPFASDAVALAAELLGAIEGARDVLAAAPSSEAVEAAFQILADAASAALPLNAAGREGAASTEPH